MLKTTAYLTQKGELPKSGKHIIAQYDSEHIVVYQAYKPSIGHFAAQNNYFGGDFKLGRMTWIKPNFLWMMFRSGWGTKPEQEVTLAIWLKRTAFDEILSQAVHSSFNSDIYTDYDVWKAAVANSNVRLQWDPDHSPVGGKLERRAVQLGLRGEIATQYAQGSWVAHIEDISDFVAEQHRHANPNDYEKLIVPSEAVYVVESESICKKLQLSDYESG